MGDPKKTAAYRFDENTFYRSAEEYGLYLGVMDENSAADGAILREFRNNRNTTAVQGGGTTYVYRNDAGGRIEITGADENWYFFAVTLDLPDPDRVVEISSAEEMAMIGTAPGYSFSDSYILTADIDLRGDPDHPWKSIGGQEGLLYFTGTFDGWGHTIEGLYVDGAVHQGLLGYAEGNAEIRNLTVRGSVAGEGNVGGIVGTLNGGTIENCVSHVTVRGELYVGGVVGSADYGSVTGCAAEGSVTGEGEPCGGIAGIAHRSVITGCRGNASVAGNSICGGIVGEADDCTLDRCVNYAAVTTAGKACGGITGAIHKSRVEYCRNLGDITAGVSMAGGITGNQLNSDISGCVNEGNVTSVYNAGGIAGSINQDGNVKNCFHTGIVAAEKHMGSLVGDGYDGIIDVGNSYSWQEDMPVVSARYEGTVTASYARSDTETGECFLPTEAFADPGSFPGWDFEYVWSLENGCRPELRMNRAEDAEQAGVQSK